MDQQLELVRDMIRRGEFDLIRAEMGMQGLGGLNDDDDQRRGHGPGNRGRDRGHPRQGDRDRSRDRNLRYSIRDIPTFDGKGDSMPHTHLIEFEDFL